MLQIRDFRLACLFVLKVETPVSVSYRGTMDNSISQSDTPQSDCLDPPVAWRIVVHESHVLPDSQVNTVKFHRIIPMKEPQRETWGATINTTAAPPSMLLYMHFV